MFYANMLLIQKHFETSDSFSFKTVEIKDIDKRIVNINPKKARTNYGIPPKMLKNSKDSPSVLHQLFNLSIEKKQDKFPQNLKLADVTRVYKKSDLLDKTNYQLTGVLPKLLKVFGRIMQKQVNGFIINFLTLHLYGYRNGFNAQRALLTEAFGTLKHNLVTAKPHASGLQHNGQ